MTVNHGRIAVNYGSLSSKKSAPTVNYGPSTVIYGRSTVNHRPLSSKECTRTVSYRFLTLREGRDPPFQRTPPSSRRRPATEARELVPGLEVRGARRRAAPIVAPRCARGTRTCRFTRPRRRSLEVQLPG